MCRSERYAEPSPALALMRQSAQLRQAPGASIWREERIGLDIEEYGEAQPDWVLNYEQLSRGSFEGYFQHVQLPGVRLVSESMNCAARQRGSIGSGGIGLSLPDRLCTEAFFHGQRAGRDCVMVGRGTELDLTTPINFSHVAIVVDERLLSEVWEYSFLEPRPRWLDGQFVLDVQPATAARVRTAHARALDAITMDPRVLNEYDRSIRIRDDLLLEWIKALPLRFEVSETESFVARKHLVKRVVAIASEWVDEPPTVLEICRLIGCSSRHLEYCFGEVLGISPSKYLRLLRLNGAHRDLRRLDRGSCSIHDVAARWGFWHMGAFSLEYKRQFDELPSVTVQTCRTLGGRGESTCSAL